jgi:phenylalanyl-tRNA synthetase beta chain
MRVPVSVLRSFVPVPVDLEALVRTLNARVSEVEHVHHFPSRAAFADVRVVEAVRPVASAAEHTRWEMVGGGHIVVGDRFGIVPGGRYAAVLAGGTLPDGTRIDARPVAGLPSDGALVSEAMLGIGKDAARPLRFAPDTAAGADAFDALGLDDVVLEFDLEPNRPDLFSLLGVARDAGAIWGNPVAEPVGLDLGALPVAASPRIDLRTPKARAYLAVTMRGVRVGPSPQWLQNLVRKLGMRPVNNVVDAANLAMFEYGQPLHTFDAARLQSGTIVLRMAADGEVLRTLDDVERTLTDECLLVCDGDRPVAIAGIMGDAASEVGDSTTDVIIESAAFDMAAVRRASRRLSLRTEASLRFEKGLPLWGVHRAAARLAGLLTEVAGATPISVSEATQETAVPRAIPLDRALVRARLGMDVADAEIDRILAASGVAVEPGAGGTPNGAAIASPPEYRPDLRIPEDLFEEIGRIHGYEHVRAEAPVLALANPRANPHVVVARRARRLFTAHGWDEVYLPAWIGDAEVERFGLDVGRLVGLINPIAENLKYFRPTALPALLEAAVQNRKELDSFGIFEVGKIYVRTAAGTIVERYHLAGIALGQPLLGVRDALLELAAASGADATLGRDAQPGFAHVPHFHPGRAVSVGATPWAVAGELHPRLVRLAGLREVPVAFAVDLDVLAACKPALVRFVPPPRFPSVAFDLNVEVGPKVEAAAVLAAVPAVADLHTVEIVDVYKLDEVDVRNLFLFRAGTRFTLRLVFNAPDRSLTQEEAAARMADVRAALAAPGWKVG